MSRARLRSPTIGGTFPSGSSSCVSGMRSASRSGTALGNTGGALGTSASTSGTALGTTSGSAGTSNAHSAGVGSTRPSSSTDRTATVCRPGARPESDTGELQRVKAAPSTLHSNTPSPRSSVAVPLETTGCAPAGTCVSGGGPSTVHATVAGDASTAP